MKKTLIISFILLLFSLLSCERVDMFEAGSFYSSRIGWFVAGENMTLAGSSVLKWEDKGDTGSTLYPSTSFYPDLITSAVAGRPAVYFTSSAFMQSAENNSIRYPFTIIMVAGNFSNGPFFSSKTNSPESFVVAHATSQFNIMPSPITVNSIFADADYRVLTIEIDKDKMLRVYENKTIIHSSYLPQADAFFDGFFIARDSGGTTGIFALAEMMIFSNILAPDKREEIITDLMNKYSL